MGRRKQSRTILFHSTTEDAAASILGGGFEDATGNYLTNREWSGVWVSDVPLDVNEGAKGNVFDGLPLKTQRAIAVFTAMYGATSLI